MAIADAYRRPRGRMPRAPSRQAGNWKLAYADFLTALVALFLVFWLVNESDPDRQSSLAGYFRGDEVAQAAGHALDTGTPGQALASQVRHTRSLAPYRDRVLVTALDDTVRIDIVDLSHAPMFRTGQSEITAAGRHAIEKVTELLLLGHWPVTIEGHTDAFPTSSAEIDNWTLSLRRADAARRLMVATGLSPERVNGVVGLGETQPLRKEEPHLAANRRVTIVLQVSE